MIYIFSTGLSVAFAIISELLRTSYKQTCKNKARLQRTLKLHTLQNVFDNKYNAISTRFSIKYFISALFAVFSAIPLIVISAFRYKVGTDFPIYWIMYKQKGLKSGRGVEPGYTFLVRILRCFTSDPQVFFVVTSIIVCGIYFYVMYKESDCFPVSVFLFVATREYFRQMNGIRQYLAVAFLLIALVYLRKEKWLSVAVFTAVACSFHYSALIIVLFIVLCRINLKPLYLLLGSFVSLVLARLFKSLLYPIVNRFTDFGGYFESSSRYSDSHFEKLTFLSYIVLMIVSIIVFKQSDETDAHDYVYYTNGVFLGLVFYALSATFPTVITRFGWYSNIFVTLYFPNVMKMIKNQAIRWAAYPSLLAFLGLWSAILIQRGNQSVLPYMFAH